MNKCKVEGCDGVFGPGCMVTSEHSLYFKCEGNRSFWDRVWNSMTQPETEKPPCSHNNRCRYDTGFQCHDCHEFFSKDSPTYRSGELLCELWCALHNILAREERAGRPEPTDALAMRDKIGIGIEHENYEELISEAETVMAKHNYPLENIFVPLRPPTAQDQELMKLYEARKNQKEA